MMSVAIRNCSAINAESVPAGNETVFADAVENLLGECTRREQLSQSARQFAEENFSLDRVRQRYVDLYVKLLQKKLG